MLLLVMYVEEPQSETDGLRKPESWCPLIQFLTQFQFRKPKLATSRSSIIRQYYVAKERKNFTIPVRKLNCLGQKLYNSTRTVTW